MPCAELTTVAEGRFPAPMFAAQVVYFVNSGSEANDMALMLARAYTGNYDIVCLRNGYHGMSMETMGLCGQHTWKQPVPQGFGIRHAMNPDPYRGPFGNDGKKYVKRQSYQLLYCAAHVSLEGQSLMQEWWCLVQKLGSMVAGVMEDSLQLTCTCSSRSHILVCWSAGMLQMLLI